MNVRQFFDALPQDLLWEVLSVFVGSHSVRKGKLVRKLVRDARSELIENLPRIEVCHIHLYKFNYHAQTFVCLRDGSQLLFCHNPKTGEKGYTFRKKNIKHYSWEPRTFGHQYTPMAVSRDEMTPYVKHTYSSYLDTDKKKAARNVG